MVVFASVFNANSQNMDNPLTHSIGLNAGYSIILNQYSGVNLGINYEIKKLNNDLGFGFFANYILANKSELLLGIPFFAHNAFGVDNLTLSFAPGMGYNGSLNYLLFEKPESETDRVFLTGKERLNLLVRLGAEWEFKLPEEKKYNFTINPYFNTDIIAFERYYLTFGIKVNYLLY